MRNHFSSMVLALFAVIIASIPLAAFAADLDDVVMGRARPVYQDPKEFFALTYPTFNLRELAKDVIVRLAGKSDKAVRQLVLTYGGGKTHALITLLHLVSEPDRLPDLPAGEVPGRSGGGARPPTPPSPGHASRCKAMAAAVATLIESTSSDIGMHTTRSAAASASRATR